MNLIKYVISLSALIALTGAQCWSAAGDICEKMSYDDIESLIPLLNTESLLQLGGTCRQYRDIFSKELYKRLLGSYPSRQAALFGAVENNIPSAIDYLVQHGVDVNERGRDGTTALMMAAKLGYEAVVDALLKNRADVDFVTNNSQTALGYAIAHGHTKIEELLRNAGARPLD